MFDSVVPCTRDTVMLLGTAPCAARETRLTNVDLPTLVQPTMNMSRLLALSCVLISATSTDMTHVINSSEQFFHIQACMCAVCHTAATATATDIQANATHLSLH
jgi:hypothetical protein